MRTKASAPLTVKLKNPGNRGAALAEHVRSILREAILSLDLLPGTVLDKNAIGEQLGVSKFPLTDALSRLQDEGLVEVRSRSGTVVSKIQVKEVLQGTFIRRCLAFEAVREIAPRVTESLIEQLDHNLNYQLSAIQQHDRTGFHEFDLDFHKLILDELSYPRVQQIIETWRGPLDRARRLHATERHQELILNEHTILKNALAAKDPEAAAQAMRVHIDGALSLMVKFMEENPSKFASGN